MAAVHILIFGKMAGFKIVPFIATHMKMKKIFHGAVKKIFQPIRTRQFSQKQLILNYSKMMLQIDLMKVILSKRGKIYVILCQVLAP